MKTLTLFFVLCLSIPALLYSSMPTDSTAIKVAIAEEYKKSMEYDKAYSLYQQLYKINPDNIDFCVACAEMEVLMGKGKDAFTTYEKILKINSDNLSANIYMGNYYFLKAESRRQKINEEYKKSTATNRARNQEYKRKLRLIYATDYTDAKKYLENVVRNFPSIEAKRTLEKIEKIEKFIL
jgi:hypothetical protein